jgi:hypothetical protein
VSVLRGYHNLYTALHFERLGLFHLLAKTYSTETVLYPGSSIHIAPSFFFPRVTYVDLHDKAKEFFRDKEIVSDFINNRKMYRRPSFVQFIARDYTQPLPLDESFDLLLALNASGVARSCKHYLKPNGYFLTNNFQDEAARTVRETDFNLVAMIKGKGERYKLILQSDSSMISDTLSKPFPRRKSNKTVVVDETFYLFRKLKNMTHGGK